MMVVFGELLWGIMVVCLFFFLVFLFVLFLFVCVYFIKLLIKR